MSIAVVAEKPAVARDLARVLGARIRRDGSLEGNGYVVTWAIGHLVALAEPHEMRPEWKRWRLDALPLLPEEWPLVVYEKSKSQFDAVRRILTSDRVDRIVCATDAGREGELIFRYIVEKAGCTKPIQRLWISSMTEEAIRAGFEHLRDGREFDGLADAARGRSRADWLVGMNLSRAYSLRHRDRLSVGRVQTPTLAMLVERELAIRSFVPEDYLEVHARFVPVTRDDASVDDRPFYEGSYVGTESGARRLDDAGDGCPSVVARLPHDGQDAERVVERARIGEVEVRSVDGKTKSTSAPLLYDLTELQRHANRLYGLTAKRTLDLAQSLYERHKLISYPRTDSRHLPQSVANELGAVVDAIRDRYAGLVAPGSGETLPTRRFVDDARVTDHHAIIPTTTRPDRIKLSSDEAKVYDLVCRRLLMSWHPDHVASSTTVITTVTTDEGSERLVDLYRSVGTKVDRPGWKVLDVVVERGRKQGSPEPEDVELPPDLVPGRRCRLEDVRIERKTTRPPRRFTEASLLTAMETAGRQLDDRELSEAMRGRGLGTPATRAAILETLLSRGYVERNKKSLVATDRGVRLIELVHPSAKSPKMTAEWEWQLEQIHRGKARLEPFLAGIASYVGDIVGRVRRAPGNAAPRRGSGDETNEAASEPPRRAPSIVSGDEAVARLPVLLRERFGHESFRPFQREVCETVANGADALVVMPTGAGKSLCYQLPGTARGGTTLVISPLIALMEDQVEKLRRDGVTAERIHSGRSRADSRAACVAYLEGRLDFLFVAPERLGVPGFPEMLAKRALALIAVDEAHCISHWGHDFRPDYRMLRERLPAFRPAPVIALTATATPPVQEDVAEQLALIGSHRFVHGFRRTNIAVEFAAMPPSARERVVEQVLSETSMRPAIVYAPTRKAAESLADRLAAHFAAAAYHAGLPTAERERVQAAFHADEVQVVVATIAFGMGIDKPDVRTVIHTAMPSSVEAYYQEIGRAGRDGHPSRAILLHGWADRKTHEFFLDRSYPDVAVLRRVFGAVTDAWMPKADVSREIGTDPEVVDAALDKLWIHGGVEIDAEDRVRRIGANETGWIGPYREQRRAREQQLTLIGKLTESATCRMAALVRHFGDERDGRQACGSCDVCDPDACVALTLREAEPEEEVAMGRILDELRRRDGQSAGRVHRTLFGESATRKDFERLVSALVRAGLVLERDDRFERDGKTVEFRRLHLSASGLQVRSVSGVRVAVVPEGAPRSPRTKAPGVAELEAAADPQLVEQLRTWRADEARRRRVPAFRVLTDRTLYGIASARPTNEEELLAIRGMGPALVRKYGAKLLALTGAV